MSDHEKDAPADAAEKFVDAVEKDPSAKRISDFATTPPVKDMASIKAASDLLEAEDEQEQQERDNAAHEADGRDGD